MNHSLTMKVAVIVAHPDDETLWTGGTLLNHAEWDCFIACLCRKNDPDRAPKFAQALNMLGAKGAMGDLNDGPEQQPMDEKEVKEMILQLLPEQRFDLVITHSIHGEYTRHLRHEEVGNAVINLWAEGELTIAELRTFAYEDGHKAYYPQPVKNADLYYMLSENVWNLKYSMITDIYGFATNSWEAETTPKAESFWQFKSTDDAKQWLLREGRTLL